MRLRAGRRILDLLDELVRAREIMREQSRKDSLTQLCTRATVLELAQAMSWIVLSARAWIGMRRLVYTRRPGSFQAHQ